ncbi:unnamed protein product [Pleuronectes platessa]|uniref:Uncharacterized protein n=1 Tax=Pleuronectes platessa TaxID=8262 RepID=A0A9N7VU88_PLEPL|nr:unnamed protein product [Pleuronectes platessa]
MGLILGTIGVGFHQRGVLRKNICKGSRQRRGWRRAGGRGGGRREEEEEEEEEEAGCNNAHLSSNSLGGKLDSGAAPPSPPGVTRRKHLARSAPFHTALWAWGVGAQNGRKQKRKFDAGEQIDGQVNRMMNGCEGMKMDEERLCHAVDWADGETEWGFRLSQKSHMSVLLLR